MKEENQQRGGSLSENCSLKQEASKMTRRECIRFVVDWCNDKWFQRASGGAHGYGVGHARWKSNIPRFTPRKCPQMPRKMPRNAESLFLNISRLRALLSTEA